MQSNTYLKRLLRKKCLFADVSDVEGDTPVKQDPSSRKRKHEQNGKEFNTRKKFKTEAATKEKTNGKVH